MFGYIFCLIGIYMTFFTTNYYFMLDLIFIILGVSLLSFTENYIK